MVAVPLIITVDIGLSFSSLHFLFAAKQPMSLRACLKILDQAR